MIETAIILAGGLGTRLRPYTEETPKPLLPLKGKPIVGQIIQNLKKHGIKQIILSVGYKADKIKEYFKNGEEWGVKISYCIEEQPLGTGGAIKKAAQGLNKSFLVLNGDNLADFNYQEMFVAHIKNKSQITLALCPVEDVTQYGIAKLEGSKIIGFIEKPKKEEAPSNLNNAGAYLFEPSVMDLLPEGVSSIERDCFEKLASKGYLYAYHHQGQWFPTDTVEKYRKACENFIPAIDLSSKKIIIADVDGTICDSCQVISKEMSEQIAQMTKRGFEFAFISGTHVQELQRMISSMLKEKHHLLGAAGTHYTVAYDGSLDEKYNHTFTTKEKGEIISAFEKLIEHVQIKPLTSKEDQLLDRGSQITLSALGRNAPSQLKASFDPDGKKRLEWIEYLKNSLGDSGYEIRLGGTTSIDITRKGLDKEWGILEFARYNKLNLNQIIFFGDKIYPGGNDYPASKIVDCVFVRNPEHTLEELRKIVQ